MQRRRRRAGRDTATRPRIGGVRTRTATGAAADPEPHPEKARIADTLVSPEGRRHHARRKWMAEAAAGWIKQATGFRRLSFRGLKKLEAGWILVCLALNVRRLHTLQAA